MPTYTTNYNLKKPAASDLFEIEDFNDNSDIVDETLKLISDEVGKKQSAIKGAATSVVDSNLTPSMVLTSDTSGKISTSAVTTDELAYLKGVRSPVQTQIDDKLSKTETAEKATGDELGNRIINTYVTNTALEEAIKDINESIEEHGVNIGGAASTIVDSNLSPKAVLISNDSGKVAVSSITSDELSKLDGVVDNIQGKLNEISTKQDKITVSPSAPSGGNSGDIWFVYKT